MNWCVRAFLIAIFGVCIFASSWAYENWYFLVFVKRLASLWKFPDYEEIHQLIVQQPPVTVSPIVIAVPPKQGTTWLGHICYQIRSRGAPIPERNQMLDMPYLERLPMDEGKLTEWRNVSGHMEPPFWELSNVEPHLLRTHLELPQLKEIGVFPKYRTLTLFRDPMDATVSAWRFIPNLVHVRHELIDHNVFAKVMLLSKYDATLQNMVEYWDKRYDSNVLIVFFDDLKADLRGMVRTVAKFMNMTPPLSEEELLGIEAQCTHSAMSGLKRFEVDTTGDVVLRKLRLTHADIVERKDLLVRAGGGTKGEGEHVLSEDIRNEMQAKWNAIVAAKTGMQNFTHYRDTIRRLRSSE